MIELVQSKPEYAELWLKWRSEPNTVRYNPIAQTPLAELRIRMEKMSSDLSNLKGSEEFRFFIQFQSQLVGTVTLKNINHMMMYGEIGYDVGESFQGKGIGTNGVKSFVEKIFAETPLRRIIAYVAEDNRASRRILEKIGFIQEGVCREHYLINGKPTNEALYGLLRSKRERPVRKNSQILSLHHGQVSIPKGGEAQARQFYCQVLGLAEIDKPGSLKARGGLWIQLGANQIHFGAEDGVDRNATKAHLAYLVSDLSEWREKFAALNIEALDGIPIPGYERFEFRDPFGNRVEFLERIVDIRDHS
jgi:RimJ/RimL family protein N-acetyltransferase/catechol 2,3-dioxygenase-like lactoylglutathione lyase family enzyme